jgi:hypothetical protein
MILIENIEMLLMNIKYNSKNLYQIRFIKNITPHWKGIAVAFWLS